MIIGLDAGNGSIGIYLKDEGQVVTDTYPSVYGAIDPNQTRLSFAKDKPATTFVTWGFAQREYVLGYEDVLKTKSTPISAYDREQRFSSKEYQTLTKLALLDAVTKTGRSGVIDITLGLGTPAEDYSEQSIALLKSWFREPVVGAKDGKQLVVMVRNIEVVSQPIAVLMDAFLDDDGFVRDEKLQHGETLVLDAGSGTLDISHFDGLTLLKQSSEPVGLNDVYQHIIESIQKEHPKMRISAYDLEAQLRAQDGQKKFSYQYGAHTLDITDYRGRAMEDTWQQLIAAVRRRCPDRSRYSTVLLAGGSAQAWRTNWLEWMPSIRLLDDPQLAVARGLGKYAKLQSQADDQ